jgi:hypothetical protein
MRAERFWQWGGAGQPGWCFRALLAAAAGQGAASHQRLLALGAEVEVHEQLYDAVAALADDPRAAHVLVVDCDGFGGVAGALRIIRQAQGAEPVVPVFLITKDCAEQAIQPRRQGPIVLRAPVTPVALCLALDQVLDHPAARRQAISRRLGPVLPVPVPGK